MGDRVQHKKPPMSAAAREWLEQETDAQERRYVGIVAEQEALTPDREQWYAEFLEIVSTRGFNVTGDQRRVISEDELPKRPDRDDAMKVVW
ncbi:MAG: hypothetical protein AAFQ62_02210 [Pseudomonadota bacterium]